MSLVLQSIQKKWMSLIAKAREEKQDKFGRFASEAMQFYGEPDHSFMFKRDSSTSSGLRVNDDGLGGDTASGLTFEATANLVSNVVSVFLPVLYHRNPVRTLTPRKPAISEPLMDQYRQMKIEQAMAAAAQQMGAVDPMMAQQMQMQMMEMAGQQLAQKKQASTGLTVIDQLRASLIEWYLNYTPNELDLKSKARDAVIEALVKGMGLLWVEFDEDDTGRRVVGLSYDSVDHLFIDPDAEKLADCKWIARRRKRPVWEVEREFGLEPGSLKGTDSSADAQSDSEAKDAFDREWEACNGLSSDLIVYYEIWSRMGIGDRIAGNNEEFDDNVTAALQSFGDFAYLVVSPSHDVPLNLPEEVLDADTTGDEARARLEWPVPFHKNKKNPWPFAALTFRRVPRKAWPQSYIHPAMGYQKCINWILSFLMTRIKLVSRAFMAIPKGVDQEIKDAILSGKDLTLLEINTAHPGTMDQLIQFIKMPEENGNIWTLLQQLRIQFEDATGVTELNMSARTSTQMRSAAEADLKRDVLSVRPDDMANEVDNWMGAAAKLEAIAARYLLTAEDVAPLFGEEVPEQQDPTLPPQYGEMTAAWVEHVQTDDVDRIVGEYEYSIEAGSARKPNAETQAQNIDEGAQLAVPQFLQIWNQVGDPSHFNAFIEEWGKSRGFANWEKFTLPDMREQIQQQQAMAMAAAGGGQPSPGPPAGEGGDEQQSPPPQEMQ
jgi:hypothetical protein